MCLATVNHDIDEQRAVSHVVIGTENREVLILNLEGSTTLSQVSPCNRHGAMFILPTHIVQSGYVQWRISPVDPSVKKVMDTLDSSHAIVSTAERTLF